LRNADEIRAICEATSRPVNVLARPTMSMREIAGAGARLSVGGRLTWVAVNALVATATTIRDHGEFSSLDVSLELERWLES
jgi:2-methylisocitrate lyase-like PEP mutase family enzyme